MPQLRIVSPTIAFPLFNWINILFSIYLLFYFCRCLLSETYVEYFCTCKKGVQQVDLESDNQTSRQLIIDCDKDLIVNTTIIRNKHVEVNVKNIMENEFKIDNRLSKKSSILKPSVKINANIFLNASDKISNWRLFWSLELILCLCISFDFL